MIGSSDGHNSGGPVEEDNYFGKFGVRDGTAERRMNSTGRFMSSKEMSAAGLAGVWASENTREAIYDAMARKETFATSGTRLKVRLFAGYNLEELDLDSEDWVNEAYDKAIPMGGDINRDGSRTPQLAIWAVKDAEGANLDRVQVIKAYLDSDGNPRERIYNVAWSGERSIDKDGNIPPVGNSVDVTDATYSNDIGAVELKTIWTDPDFDPDMESMYYLRVLEIPTPRWSTYDAVQLGISVDNNLDATIQERAWSSPIWYMP